ncbi:UNVERIFIED_CONTAM: hypothetical protein K2H54_034284 [Gekko kuhli]
MALTAKAGKARGDGETERATAEKNPAQELERMRLQVELAKTEAKKPKRLEMARIQAESEKEKEQAERAERLEREKLEWEKEKAEREHQLAMAKLQAEREEKERQREQEKEMYELKLREIQVRAKFPNPHREGPSVEQKKFPKYSRGDDVEAFLFSFERTCQDLKVADEDRMLYLCPQICGGLSEIYSEMRDEETSNYDLFKERVRVRYGLTAEQSRKTFRDL